MRHSTLADPLTVALVAGLGVALAGLVALGWSCYRLLVDRGHLLLQLADPAHDDAPPLPRGPRAGSHLSDFALPMLHGGTATLSGLLERPLLLVFVRPDCLFSRALVQEMATWTGVADGLRPVLIVSGDGYQQDALEPFAGVPGPLLLDPQGQVARLMRVDVTPAGCRVALDRHTVGPLLTGPSALLAAARGESAFETAALPPAVTILPKRTSAGLTPLAPGDLAPRFTLPTVAGDMWPLERHLGQPLTVIFADPECPPCRPLLAAVSQLPTAGLVVVSRGDREENRRLAALLGPIVPVVMRERREVARAYGALETPAAYRITADGAIAAGPAIGTEEVLALIAENDRVAVETRQTGSSRILERP